MSAGTGSPAHDAQRFLWCATPWIEISIIGEPGAMYSMHRPHTSICAAFRHVLIFMRPFL